MNHINCNFPIFIKIILNEWYSHKSYDKAFICWKMLFCQWLNCIFLTKLQPNFHWKIFSDKEQKKYIFKYIYFWRGIFNFSLKIIMIKKSKYSEWITSTIWRNILGGGGNNLRIYFPEFWFHFHFTFLKSENSFWCISS